MSGPSCVSLFSGIGGLDLGLARAGFRHLAFCESDAYRRDVLAARWPGVPIYEDVRAIGEPAGRTAADGDSAPADIGRRETRTGIRRSPHLLCGGFPCQDLSVAGQRKGLAGDRSGLFHEFARIAGIVRPRWLLVENVPGLLSSNGGRDFGVVLGTLADLGYGLAWRILDSRFFGVPQRRRRVFVVGALAVGDPRAAAERAGQVLAIGSRCPRHPATRGEAGPDVAYALADGSGSRTGSGRDGQDTFVSDLPISSRIHEEIAPTLQAARSENRGGTDGPLIAVPLSHGSNPNSNAAGRRREDDENLVPAFHQTQEPIHGDDFSSALGRTSIGMGLGQGASVRRLTPTECERLQALPDGWTELGGTADSKRYAALGDAVTASVAEWIGRRLVSQDRGD